MEEKNIKTAWKVLRVGFDGVLLSAIDGPGETEYPRGEWKKRTDFKNSGPYALFATEKEAVELKKDIGERAVVYVAEYTPSNDKSLWVGAIKQPPWSWLENIIYADAVKLIRRLV